MNKNQLEFEKNLKKAGMNDETINKIVNVSYKESDNENRIMQIIVLL